jgi:hypothetical protein
MKTPTHVRAAELAIHCMHLRDAANALVRECEEIGLPLDCLIVSNLDESAGHIDAAREGLEELSKRLQAKLTDQ